MVLFCVVEVKKKKVFIYYKENGEKCNACNEKQKFVGAGFSQGETTRTPFFLEKHEEIQIVHGKF